MEDVRVIVREGHRLRVPRVGASFPGRCVVCNAPVGDERHELTLTSHSGWVYFFTLISGAPATSERSTRNQAFLQVGICARHRARRRNGLFLAAICGAIALALLVVSSGRSLEGVMRAIAAMLLAVAVAAELRTRIVQVARIEGPDAWIEVGRPFLRSFRDHEPT